MPGARVEQSALNLFAELRRAFSHGAGRPEIHRHLLLTHARLQGVDRLPRLGALEHQQRAVLLEQVGAGDAVQQALPGIEAAFVERAQTGHGALKRRRAQVQQQSAEPRHGARQVLPVQAQRPHRVHQHRRQTLEDRRVGNRKHLLSGQVSGVAERGAMTGRLLVDDHHPFTLTRQLQSAGDADDAGADHRDVGVVRCEVVRHVQASLWPSSKRRSCSGFACFSGCGSRLSGKS